VPELWTLYEGTVLRRNSRKFYEKAIPVVTTVINEWDPYGLIGGGAPDDEFDGEIRSIVRQLGRVHSAEDATHAVSRVFSSSFEVEKFGLDACRAVGKKLYLALKAEALLD
jgi:hypothetical protein